MADLSNGIVVRAIASTGAFNSEEVDQHGRLLRASVNAVNGNNDPSTAMVGMRKGNYRKYATCSVKDIVQKGGRVMPAPQGDNPNHCQISGLTLKTANNLFSHHLDWA